MSRKFVEREGQIWVNKGIVTTSQIDQILNLYDEKKRAVGLLPLFGSILVGLGILLYIASNWQGIPDLFRIAILFVLLAGFYGLGEWFLRKDSPRLGIAFTGIGLITFGANIILLAQMFNMEAYNVMMWIIWGIVGIVMTYMYRSRYLYLITTLIFSIAQLQSTLSMNQFSYVTAIVMVLGLGSYLLLNRNLVLAWAFTAATVLQAIVLVNEYNLNFYWVFIPILALYVIGDILRDPRISMPFQFGPLASLFIYQVVLVLAYDDGLNNDFFAPLQEQYGFLIGLVVLFAISVYFKIRSKRALSAVEWAIAPYMLFFPNYADLYSLIIIFLFSLFVLWGGYSEQWNFKINLGTFLFLASTMTAYGKLTWDFMDRSLFFIIGGLLLLAVSWFLNRGKKEFMKESKEA